MTANPVFTPELHEFFLCDEAAALRADVVSWAKWRAAPHETLDEQWTYLSALFRNHSEFRSVLDYRLLKANAYRGPKIKPEWPRATDLYIYADAIGGGFRVQHGHSTWVMAETIGENFHVNQNVTIGVGAGGKPTIGNNVSVYTGAVVTGNIRIGNNVSIAPNAFINFDVEDDMSVFPAPMVVKAKRPRPKG